MPPAPYALLSGGMSVSLIQVPLAYAKKSSPGLTDRSMPARSIPTELAVWSLWAHAARGVASRASVTKEPSGCRQILFMTDPLVESSRWFRPPRSQPLLGGMRFRAPAPAAHRPRRPQDRA